MKSRHSWRTMPTSHNKRSLSVPAREPPAHEREFAMDEMESLRPYVLPVPPRPLYVLFVPCSSLTKQ